MQRDEESKQEYKEMRRQPTEVAKTNTKAYDELCEELDTKEGEKDIVPIGETETTSGKRHTTC